MPYSAGTTNLPCPTRPRLLLLVLFAALQWTRDAVCQAAHYCSKKCQGEDWPLHRLPCGSYGPFIATRPESKTLKPVGNDKTHGDYKAAIHFPCISEQPTLIWVKIETTRREYIGKSKAIGKPNLCEKC